MKLKTKKQEITRWIFVVFKMPELNESAFRSFVEISAGRFETVINHGKVAF